ncbi:hypothetical protein BDZ45DRAFT_722663 [Acephala macrosclerotiorum]|nr:hypothetical protein BDZ45DRAFT_722663 [Acephala macrosclerotiorum]
MDATVQTPLGATGSSSTPSTTPSSTVSAASGGNPPRHAAKWTDDEKNAFNDLCQHFKARMTPGQINGTLQAITDRLKNIGYHKTLNQCRQQWYGVARFDPQFADAPSGPRVMVAAISNQNAEEASPAPSAIGQADKISPTPVATSKSGSETSGHAAAEVQRAGQGTTAEVAARGRNKAWSAYECDKLIELVNARREQETSDPNLPKLSISKLMAIVSPQLKEKYNIDRTPDGCAWTLSKLVRQAKHADSAPVVPPLLSPLSKDIEAKLDDVAASTKRNSQDKKALTSRTTATGKSHKVERFPVEDKERLIEAANKTLYPSDETVNALAEELKTTVRRIRMFFTNARAGHYGFSKGGESENGTGDAEYVDMSSNSPDLESSRKNLKRGRTGDSINLDTNDDDYPLVLHPSKKARTAAVRTMRSAPIPSTDNNTPPGKVKMVLPRHPSRPSTHPANSRNSIGGAPPPSKQSPVRKARHSTGQLSHSRSQILDGKSWNAMTLRKIQGCDEKIASFKDTKAHTLAEINADDAAVQALQTQITSLSQQMQGLTNSVNAKRTRIGDLDAQIDEFEQKKTALQVALEYED